MVLRVRAKPLADFLRELTNRIRLKPTLMSEKDGTILTAEIPAVVACLKYLALKTAHILDLFQSDPPFDVLQQDVGRLFPPFGFVYTVWTNHKPFITWE